MRSCGVVFISNLWEFLITFFFSNTAALFHKQFVLQLFLISEPFCVAFNWNFSFFCVLLSYDFVYFLL